MKLLKTVVQKTIFKSAISSDFKLRLNFLKQQSIISFQNSHFAVKLDHSFPLKSSTDSDTQY